MGTLSKTRRRAAGTSPAISALIEALRYSAPGFVFSVGLPPPMAAAALAALRAIRAEPLRVARLRSNGALFLREAKAPGLDTGNSTRLGIVPVMVGSTLRAGGLTPLFSRGASIRRRSCSRACR